MEQNQRKRIQRDTRKNLVNVGEKPRQHHALFVAVIALKMVGAVLWNQFAGARGVIIQLEKKFWLQQLINIIVDAV